MQNFYPEAVKIDVADGEVLLPMDLIKRAKLVLTDELIRDVLRQRKDAGEVDETQFDEIQTIIDGEEEAAEAAREEN